MFKKPISLIEFILEDEKRFTKAQGNFTLLMMHLEYASRIIASHIREAGLVDILGATGSKNTYQEEVQKLDQLSNTLLVDILSSSGEVSLLASEELENAIHVNDARGDYTVFFDPLDGSSNIDVNVTIGTIFSIYHSKKDILQPGNNQVAAGYILYGPSIIFVYTCGNGVNGFTLDPSIGSFLLSHPNIKIPQKGSTYSINEGNYNLWDEGTKKYIDHLKDQEKPYKSRYVGSLVADLHRTLLKGGIYLYPQDTNSKHGKLRLMYEINPMSFLLKQAGGKAVSSGVDPLSIKPSDLHQKVPIAFGSKDEVDTYMKFQNL